MALPFGFLRVTSFFSTFGVCFNRAFYFVMANTHHLINGLMHSFQNKKIQ